MAEAVKVIVRCRPLNQREKNLKCLNIIEMDDKIGQCRLMKPKEKNQPPKAFTFDGVFGVDSITETIYADICFPLIEGIVEGYNGTVFAYGQTGCGKSFTMQGIEDPPSQRGIIPRGFEHVFESIQILDNIKFLVNASYLEIYNEDIRDLLGKDVKGKLEVKEHPDKGVYVKDLSLVRCASVKDMEKLMDKGGQNRSVGATLMNADSSRSHSIFTIYVETCETGADGEEHIRAGKLHLVDLAGSERQAKTGATGDRLKEATKINLSLSALGNVISSLVDGKSKHIPYRDSKLTRLLQDSLGGNTKTLMVACISPADNNYEETLSTLRYANRAKNIKNKPKINEDPKDALLRQYQDEINMLKQLLTGQLQMTPILIAQLGLTGTAASSVAAVKPTMAPTSLSVNETVPSELEKDTSLIKEEYEEKLAALQKKFEEEQLDKRKLADEIAILQQNLNAKLKEVSSQHGVIVENLDPGDIMVRSISNLSKDMESSGEHVPAFSDLTQIDEQKILDTNKVITDEQLSALSNDGNVNIQEEAVKRLNSLQVQLAQSEKEVDKAELKKKHNLRKSHYNKRQQRMMKEIQRWESEGIMVKVYDNLQDEIKDKNTTISKLEDEINCANSEIVDLQSEFQNERDDYLDSIRKLERQLMLQGQLLDKIQPTIRRDCNYYNIDRIKLLSEFDEESQRWKLPELQIERTSLPKTALEKENSLQRIQSLAQELNDYDRRDTFDKYAHHIQNSGNEEFSNNYFKSKRADKLLSNSNCAINSVFNDNNNNAFRMMAPAASHKSPLPELTRRPLKLEALPPSAFDKKKKKSRSKESY